MAIRNIKDWLMFDKARLALILTGIAIAILGGLLPLFLHYVLVSIPSIELIITSSFTTGGIFAGLGVARNGMKSKQDKMIENTVECVEIHKILQNQINIQSVKTDQTREMIIEILAKLKHQEKKGKK